MKKFLEKRKKLIRWWISVNTVSPTGSILIKYPLNLRTHLPIGCSKTRLLLQLDCTNMLIDCTSIERVSKLMFYQKFTVNTRAWFCGIWVSNFEVLDSKVFFKVYMDTIHNKILQGWDKFLPRQTPISYFEIIAVSRPRSS